MCTLHVPAFTARYYLIYQQSRNNLHSWFQVITVLRDRSCAAYIRTFVPGFRHDLSHHSHDFTSFTWLIFVKNLHNVISHPLASSFLCSLKCSGGPHPSALTTCPFSEVGRHDSIILSVSHPIKFSFPLTHLSQLLKPLPPFCLEPHILHIITSFFLWNAPVMSSLFSSSCSSSSLSRCQAPAPSSRGHSAQALFPFIKHWLNCKIQLIVSYYNHFLILVLLLSLSPLPLSVSYSLSFTLSL